VKFGECNCCSIYTCFAFCLFVTLVFCDNIPMTNLKLVCGFGVGWVLPPWPKIFGWGRVFPLLWCFESKMWKQF
jgi:hypothetical protein